MIKQTISVIALLLIIFAADDVKSQDIREARKKQRAQSSIQYIKSESTAQDSSVVEKSPVKPIEDPYNLMVEEEYLKRNEDIYYTAAGGVSIPIGTFSSSDTISDANGFAKAGFFFEMAPQYRINYRWNLSIKLRYTLNPIDEDQYAKMLTARAPSTLSDYIKDIEQTEVLQMLTDYWSGLSVLPGAAYRVPYKKVKFEFRGELGVMYGYSANHQFRLSDISEISTSHQYTDVMTSGNSFNFAAGAGAGVHFKVKRSTLQANIHYFTSGYDVEYEQAVNLSSSQSVETVIGSGSNSVDLSILALTVGLIF